MIKAIVFNTEEEAKQWDWHHNKLTGSISKYRYHRVPLNSTTSLTKVEYAELMGIPEQIDNTPEGEIISNPAYEALEDSYTIDKYALLVGDDLDVVDEEGNVTGYACQYCGEEVEVVDISNQLKGISEE